MKKYFASFFMAMLLILSVGAYAEESDVATPNISVTTKTGQATFTLKSDTEDVKIYYTINGTSPVSNGKKYSGAVKITATCEVRAVAYDADSKEYSDEGYYLVTVTKERAGKPVFKATSVAGGKKITISSSTSGASIYYTTNGSTPTTSSKKYTSAGITVTDDTVIKAIAYKNGMENSRVETATVYVPELAEPKITVSSSTQKVTITGPSGATIYYTTNGSTPTTSSKKYTAAFTLSSEATVKAVAYKNGYKKSDVAVKEVEGAKLASPTAKKTAIEGGYKVTLEGPSGASIYYTTDGSTPTTSSKKYTSSGIKVTEKGTTEIRAFSYKSGSNSSSVVSFKITVNRVSAPTIKTSETSGGTKVTMSASSGATIYYTTNGKDPTTSSKKYTGAFTVTSSCTIKAIASKQGYAVSEVEEEEIYSGASAPKATKTAIAGGYNVKLTTETGGASIYYTTDGSEPTTKSTKYTSSGIKITEAGTTYIRAVAYKSGNGYSEETEFDITVSKLAAPKASASSSSNGYKIKLTGSSGATIYYTTNGSTPTTSSKKYTSAFTVTSSCTIKAIAVKNGYANSAVYTGKVNIESKVANPTATQKAYSTYTAVTFKCTTSGAKIYYTTDGSDPSEYGKAVSSGTTVKIYSSCLLRYVAKKSGYNDSPVVRSTVNVADDDTIILGLDGEDVPEQELAAYEEESKEFALESEYIDYDTETVLFELD